MNSPHNPMQSEDTATRHLAEPIPLDRYRAYSAVEPAPTRIDSKPLPAVDAYEPSGEFFPSGYKSGTTPAQPQWYEAPTDAVDPHRSAARAKPTTGVRIGPFCGAVVVTCLISGLLVWLLAWVLTAAIGVVPESYWASTGVVPTPPIPTGVYVGWAVAANLATAGLLFVLIKLAIAPVGRWFGLLTMLLTGVAVAWSISTGGPWQHWAPTALVIAVCGLSMASWGRGYGRATTVNIHDF